MYDQSELDSADIIIVVHWYVARTITIIINMLYMRQDWQALSLQRQWDRD
jgi:hypothetical protein